MRILVTGGAGYVGSHLAEALRRAGHRVRVLDLRPAGGDAVQGSVADSRTVGWAVRGADLVYHLAWDFRREDEGREVEENLLGTLTLLQAALAARVRHMVFASSAVVYGPTGPIRVREDHPCHPEKSTIGGATYGITKLACERLCLVHERRGLPVTIFRIHGVFGEDRLSQFQRMIGQARAGEAVRAIRGAGGEYAHIDDVLGALLLVAGSRAAKGEVFNLAGANTYWEPDLARLIVEATGAESGVELIEDPTARMVSVSVDKLRRVLGFEPGRGEFLSGLIRRALDSPSRPLAGHSVRRVARDHPV